MKKISFMLVAFAMIMTSFLVVGCGKEKTTDTITKITLNEVTHSIFYAPLYVAINNGYFADENIEIELVNGGGADNSMTALLSGDAEIGLMGPEAAVYVAAGDAQNKAKIFGQLTKRDGSFIVSKEDIQDFTLADLVGEEIIGGRAGGMPAMTLEYTIKQAGYEVGKGADQIDLNTGVDFALTSSVFKETDAKFCTLFEPSASALCKDQEYYIVESLGTLSGEVPYTAFMANEDWLKENDDVAFNFLKAVYRGYAFVKNANFDEIVDALKPSFADYTDESIITSITNYIDCDAWVDTPFFTEQAFDTLQDVIESAGDLEKRVDYADIIDNTIAKKVEKYFYYM